MAKGLYVQIACRLPDKPEIIEAGDIAELVYYRAIIRCREHLTDGVIDRRVIARWFSGIRGRPATHLDRLQAVGLLEPHERGWCIPLDVWCEWNPTAAEVEAMREAENRRKREWRERRARESSDDDDATATRRERDASRDANATRPRRPRDAHATDTRRARDAQPEPEPEPEPKPEPEMTSRPRENSPSRGRRNPAARAAGDPIPITEALARGIG